MVKHLKFEGNTYEGIFMPLPGKQNYGHLMVDGVLLKDNEGVEVIFGLGRAEEVFLQNDDHFPGFINLNEKAKMKPAPAPKEEEVPKPIKTIKLNNREEIQAMSKDAEEIMFALRKSAVNGIVYLKEVTGVNQNKLYGHIVNLEKAKVIKRFLDAKGNPIKDKKRGTKIKILQ